MHNLLLKAMGRIGFEDLLLSITGQVEWYIIFLEINQASWGVPEASLTVTIFRW